MTVVFSPEKVDDPAVAAKISEPIRRDGSAAGPIQPIQP
jgi:hypothetical protein